MGAYISDFGVFIPTYAGTAMLTGCYKIPNAYANVKGVFTNTNPVDAYRGAGRPEAAYLIERLIDKSAKDLNFVNKFKNKSYKWKWYALYISHMTVEILEKPLSCVEFLNIIPFKIEKTYL